MTPVFLIATPTFNSCEFIDQTIQSVIFQAGAFRIRYHVQDGGSSDSTLARLEHWRALLQSGTLPLLCEGVEFSFASESDRGMYDAIQRAFAHLAATGEEYMSYINADDCLMPGALQAVVTVFTSYPGTAWLSGRSCVMNQQGETTRIHDAQVYPAATLRAGLHDGRSLSFVMQEGTFWRATLWQKSGGFRTSFRQAGDWDLWRRFARESPLVTIETVLAAHRRRDAQLTADMSTYYREVDETIAAEGAELQAAEWKSYGEWASGAGEDGDERYYGSVLQFKKAAARAGSGHWIARLAPYRTSLRTSLAVTNGFTRIMLAAEFGEGFGPSCDADQELNLLAGYRVTQGAVCRLSFEAKGEGLHRIFLRCRVFDRGVHIELADARRTILRAQPPVTAHDRDCVMMAESVFAPGRNAIELHVTGEDRDKQLFVMVITCEAMATV
ncbi:MAG: glycosyltransferase [Candidatus Solibacter sp.]